jgi:hypothetical protein
LDKLIKKLCETGSTERKKGSGRLKSARTAQDVTAASGTAWNRVLLTVSSMSRASDFVHVSGQKEDILNICCNIAWDDKEMFQNSLKTELILAFYVRKSAILNFQICQGSAATRLRCSLKIYMGFIGNLVPITIVKEFWKSVNIWPSYSHE